MPNIDPAAINTVLLTLLGVGGSVFIMRYVRPILDTQEKHRIGLTAEVATLTAKVEAGDQERILLREMVTQRAAVDDLSQRLKMAVDDNVVSQRGIIQEIARHDRVGEEAHQRQLLVMNEMVAALREVSDRLHRGSYRGERGGERGHSGERGEGGERGPAGPTGKRGEKGDHGQDWRESREPNGRHEENAG